MGTYKCTQTKPLYPGAASTEKCTPVDSASVGVEPFNGTKWSFYPVENQNPAPSFDEGLDSMCEVLFSQGMRR